MGLGSVAMGGSSHSGLGEHTTTATTTQVSSSSIPSGFIKFQQTLHEEQQPTSISETHTLVTAANRTVATTATDPGINISIEEHQDVVGRNPSTIHLDTTAHTPAVLPTPPTIPLLQSVLDRLDEIETESTAQSVQFFRKFAFVGGMVTPETFLAQSGTALLLVKWRALLYHVVVQRVFTKWQRHPIVAFSVSTSPSASKMLKYALVSSMTTTISNRRRHSQTASSQNQNADGATKVDTDDVVVVSPHSREEAINSMMQHLHEWRHMLADYFGIVFKTAMEISLEGNREEEDAHHQRDTMNDSHRAKAESCFSEIQLA